MARSRRRRITVGYGKARVSYEWVGFADGGTDTNLDTTTSFELWPPGAADSVAEPDVTVLRIVGNISLGNQSAVTSNAAVGIHIGVRSVGRDQTIDEAYVPLSTDADDLDNGRMFNWVSTKAGPAVVVADLDTISLIIPVDIKVGRKMNKRDTLVCTIQAAVTARKTASVNLRALIRSY